MAGDFEIGEGYVKVTTKVDERDVERGADRAGERFEDKFSAAIEKGSTRSRSRLSALWGKSGDDSSKSFTSKLLSGVVGGFTKLGQGIAGTFTGLRTAIGPAVGMLGAVVQVAALVGPALVGAGSAVVGFTSAALAAAPALVLLRGQISLAVAIIESFGPAILKSMSPVTDAFKSAHEEASALASRGLTPLAEKFVQVNFPAIRDMLNRIAISTNNVLTAFINWANTAEGVGAIRNITRGIADLVSGIEGPVKETGIAFLQMLGRISEVSTAAGVSGLTGVLSKVRDVMNSITAESVQSGLDRMSGYFTNIANAVRSTVDFGKAVWDFYQQFRTQIQLTIDALGILAVVFGGPITAAIAAAGLIIRHWDQVKAFFATAREWFSGVEGGTQILGRLRDIAGQVWDALKRAFDTIRDAVAGPLASLGNTVRDTLLPALGNLLVAIGPIIPILIDHLAPAIGGAIAMFISLVNVTAQVIAAVARVLTAVIENAGKVRAKVDEVVGFFRELPGRVNTAISNLPTIVGNVISTTASRAAYLVGYLIGTAVRLFLEFPGKVRNAILATPGIVASMLTTAGSRAKSGAQSLVTGTVNYLKTLPAKARSAIAGVPGQIKSVFSGAGSWLYSAGANILKGLVNGIKSAIPATVNAVKGVGGSVIGGIKSGLGIKSPSVLAEKEVGRWIPPGITKGVEKALPAENQKIQGLVPSVATSAAAGTVAAPSMSTSNRTDIANLNVNVRGVLDPDNPAAMRALIAKLYEELAKYERSYA